MGTTIKYTYGAKEKSELCVLLLYLACDFFPPYSPPCSTYRPRYSLRRKTLWAPRCRHRRARGSVGGEKEMKIIINSPWEIWRQSRRLLSVWVIPDMYKHHIFDIQRTYTSASSAIVCTRTPGRAAPSVSGFLFAKCRPLYAICAFGLHGSKKTATKHRSRSCSEIEDVARKTINEHSHDPASAVVMIILLLLRLWPLTPRP